MTFAPHTQKTQKAQKISSFEIKSSQLSILVFHLKSSDLLSVAEDMEKQFADTPDFFNDEPVLIDAHLLETGDGFSVDQANSEQSLDFIELIRLLSRYRLKPVGVRGLPAILNASAIAAGLFIDSEDPGLDESRAGESNRKQDLSKRADEPAELKVLSPMSAMVIDKPLRSGQQVYARGRDLILMAMVNPGAEVIADGNIHAYAPLRGKAMAGAAGDVKARIFAAVLEAELLSIAGVWQTSEALQKDAAWGGPAQVRLVLEDGPRTGSIDSQQATPSVLPDSAPLAKLVISRLRD